MSAWLTLDLDTTPPVAQAEAPARVDAGEAWEVLVRANEDLGACGAFYLDTDGQAYPVGYEQVSTRSLRFLVPTLSLTSGELRVAVRDRVCNLTWLTVPVTVVRESPFDLTLRIGKAWETTMSTSGAYDVEIRPVHGLDADLTVDHGAEVTADVTHSFDVTLEVTGG